MNWIYITISTVYLTIGLIYAVNMNRKLFGYKGDRHEIEEPMLFIHTAIVAFVWIFILIIGLIRKNKTK